MPRGRRKELDPRVRWHLLVPSSTSDAVDKRLSLQNPFGPEHGAPHGAKSELVNSLMRRWLSQQDRMDQGIILLQEINRRPVSEEEKSRLLLIALKDFLTTAGYRRMAQHLEV